VSERGHPLLKPVEVPRQTGVDEHEAARVLDEVEVDDLIAEAVHAGRDQIVVLGGSLRAVVRMDRAGHGSSR
jgi:hypothetical protein